MKNKKETQDTDLRVRCSTGFKKELEARAKKLNLSLSAYVRMKLSIVEPQKKQIDEN